MKNSLVFFIAAMLLINLQSGNAQTRGLVFGDVVWQILIPDNPGTTLQDKQVRSLKQIPDVNGDSKPDLLLYNDRLGDDDTFISELYDPAKPSGQRDWINAVSHLSSLPYRSINSIIESPG